MITTVTLAQGAAHMTKQKVIVKNLASIQNFGSMDILCSDKTGTLTSGNTVLHACLDPLGQPSQPVLLYAYINSFCWDIKLIRDFMLYIGPVSSIFDFLTFFIMLQVFHASAPLFHTGWFVESLATQTLVLFIIRTTGNPLHSRPSLPLTVTGCSSSLSGCCSRSRRWLHHSASRRFGSLVPTVMWLLLIARRLFRLAQGGSLEEAKRPAPDSASKRASGAAYTSDRG